MIIADTSALLAALDPDEAHHEACRGVLQSLPDPLVLSPFVLCELDYLLLRKRGVTAELALLSDVVAGAYALAAFDSADVASAQRLIATYDKLGIGLADASLVVLADRYRTNQLFTLDSRHFRIVRTLGGTEFVLLPEDSLSD